MLKKLVGFVKDYGSYYTSTNGVSIQLKLVENPYHSSWDRRRYWWLQTIVVDKHLRRQGRGTAVMEELCRRADDQKLHIYLEVEPLGDDTMTYRQLFKWYRKFGFKRYAKGKMRRHYRT